MSWRTGRADCPDRCAGRQLGQCFLRAYLQSGVYVLAGVNAPMLLAMVPMLESAMDTQELITQGIQAAREGVCLSTV